MSRLPEVRPRDLLKALQKVGFVKDRQSGSHIYLKHSDGRLTSISIHSRPLPKGTLNTILKQTRIKAEELRKSL